MRHAADDPSLPSPGPRIPPKAAARHLPAGFWRLADPKVSLASFASLFLGSCAAAAHTDLHWGWLALTVLGIFCIEVAKNASGEVFDFDSGTDLAVLPEDRSPFSGGKRVLVDGLLSRGQTVFISAVFYVLGIGCGLVIAFFREPNVLWLGCLGVGLAIFYHAPPPRLSYIGLGEVAVAIAYGPLLVAGACLVQTGDLPPEVIAASLPLGLLIGAFLWINEFPDFRADRESGKRNLVVRLGRRAASRVFVVLVGTAFLLLAALPALGAPTPVWFGGIALIPASWAARRLVKDPETTGRIIPAQTGTLASFVLYASGAGLGWVAA